MQWMPTWDTVDTVQTIKEPYQESGSRNFILKELPKGLKYRLQLLVGSNNGVES